MRVLHVMECTIGGTRRHLVDVCAGQRAAGLDVAVAASALRQPDFEQDLARLAQQGVRVHRVPMVRAIAPWRDLSDLRALTRVLRQERPDVVHTHSSKAGALGRAASLLTGIGARVHTPHTFAFLFDAMFSAPKRALFRRIERSLGRRTDRIVAVSGGEARTMADSGVVDPARIRVVESGIDPAPWLDARPVPRAELCGRPAAPLLAVVGLLNVAKGQDLLLDALASPGLDELQVIVVGHGEDEAALRARCARLGLDARVRFLGFRRDVPGLLAAADALVLPSRWEGMPYAVLEAMASARTVVATPVDGARDLVEHGATGILARAIAADALADALRAWLALGPGRRAAMGATARERLLAAHTDAAMIAGLARVYAEVV